MKVRVATARSWAETMKMYLELAERTDEELAKIFKKGVERYGEDTVKGIYAAKLLRKRGYRPAVLFEKNGKLIGEPVPLELAFWLV